MDQQQMKHLLIAILDCGPDDLSILKGTTYGWSDIIERAKDVYSHVSLDSLFCAIIEIGKDGLRAVIDERIEELEASLDSDVSELTDEERKELEDEEREEREELEALRQLSVEEDVDVRFNFLDSSAHIIQHLDTYETYLSEALSNFEENTGFSPRQ